MPPSMTLTHTSQGGGVPLLADCHPQPLSPSPSPSPGFRLVPLAPVHQPALCLLAASAPPSTAAAIAPTSHAARAQLPASCSDYGAPNTAATAAAAATASTTVATAACAFATTTLAVTTIAAACTDSSAGTAPIPPPPSAPLPSLPPTRPPPTPKKGSAVPPSTPTVVLTLVTSGSVSDYSNTSSLRQTIATAAGVNKEDVQISVAAASVVITATISVPAATTASAVQSSLSSTLGVTAESASTALDVIVESTPTVAIVLLPSTPPPPATPPRPRPPASPPSSEDDSLGDAKDDVSTCNVFCSVDATLGFELYILLGGLALTGVVLIFAAYSKVRVKLSGADILSSLLAAGDALTDIAFTMQRLGIMHTTAD